MKREKSARRNLAAPSLDEQKHEENEISATLRFITPMFGGGVRLNTKVPQLKAPDSVTLVRGASVRGHLREWWRRLCCAELPLEQMRAREKVLWGWASTKDEPAKGWVSITITSDLQAAPISVFRMEKTNRGFKVVDTGKKGVAYGAFPLQPPAPLRQDSVVGTLSSLTGTFQVTLARGRPLSKRERQAWPDGATDDSIWAEACRAFDTWTTLGGLGGRTRRGFGAIELVHEAVPTQVKLERLGIEVFPAQRSAADALSALNSGLSSLQAFRQRQEPGRDGERAKGDLRVWRTALGLPIVLKDQGVLMPLKAHGDRLATPVLIRPLRFGNVYRAVAVRLRTRLPLSTLLTKLRHGDKIIQGPADPEHVVLDPFLAYFSE